MNVSYYLYNLPNFSFNISEDVNSNINCLKNQTNLNVPATNSSPIKSNLASTSKAVEHFQPGHCSSICKLVFGEETNSLYTAAQDSTVRRWKQIHTNFNNENNKTSSSQSSSQESQNYSLSLREDGVLFGHSNQVTDIALTTDEKIAFTSSHDKTFRIQNQSTCDCLQSVFQHTDYIECLDFCSNTGKIVTAGLCSQLFLWDVANLNCPLIDFSKENNYSNFGSIYAMDVDVAGRYLVTGSTDAALRFFDLRTGEIVFGKKQHQDNIRCVKLNDDSTMCLSASTDNTINLWDMRQNTSIAVYCPSQSLVMDENGSGSNLDPSSFGSIQAMCVDKNFENVWSAGGRHHLSRGRICSTNLLNGTTSILDNWQCHEPIVSLAMEESSSGANITTLQASTYGTPSLQRLDLAESSSSGREIYEPKSNTDSSPYSSSNSIGTFNVSTFCSKQVCKVEVQKGNASFRRARVLNDGWRLLTLDDCGRILLWNCVEGKLIKDYGINKCFESLLENELKIRKTVSSQFTVELILGCICIKLEPKTCFNGVTFEDVFDKYKQVNLGFLTLKNLFKGMLSNLKCPKISEKFVEKTSKKELNSKDLKAKINSLHFSKNLSSSKLNSKKTSNNSFKSTLSKANSNVKNLDLGANFSDKSTEIANTHKNFKNTENEIIRQRYLSDLTSNSTYEQVYKLNNSKNLPLNQNLTSLSRRTMSEFCNNTVPSLNTNEKNCSSPCPQTSSSIAFQRTNFDRGLQLLIRDSKQSLRLWQNQFETNQNQTEQQLNLRNHENFCAFYEFRQVYSEKSLLSFKKKRKSFSSSPNSSASNKSQDFSTSSHENSVEKRTALLEESKIRRLMVKSQCEALVTDKFPEFIHFKHKLYSKIIGDQIFCALQSTEDPKSNLSALHIEIIALNLEEDFPFYREECLGESNVGNNSLECRRRIAALPCSLVRHVYEYLGRCLIKDIEAQNVKVDTNEDSKIQTDKNVNIFSSIELLCNNKILDPNLDLQTVRDWIKQVGSQFVIEFRKSRKKII